MLTTISWQFIKFKKIISNYDCSKNIDIDKYHANKPAEYSLYFVKFLFLWVVVYVGHVFICFYADDLLYASAGITQDNEFSFVKTTNFLIDHYLFWGGRVVSFFFMMVISSLGSDFFFFVQSFVISLILYLIAKIASFNQPKNLDLYLLLSVIAYCSIDISIVRDSIYWASASCTYIWPILFFLQGYYALLRKQLHGKGSTIILYILFFLSSVCNELVAMISIVSLGMVAVVDYMYDKKIHFLPITSSVAGFAFLYLSPGNHVRMAELKRDWGYVFPQNASEYAGEIKNAALWISELPPSTLSFFILTFISILYIFFKTIRGERNFICLIPIAVAWLVPFVWLIFPPSRALRVLSPQIIISILFIVVLFSALFQSIQEKVRTSIIAALFIICCSNYLYIVHGYHYNYRIIQENDRVLQTFNEFPFNEKEYFSRKLVQLQENSPNKEYTYEKMIEEFKKSNMNPYQHYVLYGYNEGIRMPSRFPQAVVHLKKLSNDLYGNVMPYSTNGIYKKKLEEFLRYYYGIMPGVQFEWLDN